MLNGNRYFVTLYTTCYFDVKHCLNHCSSRFTFTFVFPFITFVAFYYCIASKLRGCIMRIRFLICNAYYILMNDYFDILPSFTDSWNFSYIIIKNNVQWMYFYLISVLRNKLIEILRNEQMLNCFPSNSRNFVL